MEYFNQHKTLTWITWTRFDWGLLALPPAPHHCHHQFHQNRPSSIVSFPLHWIPWQPINREFIFCFRFHYTNHQQILIHWIETTLNPLISINYKQPLPYYCVTLSTYSSFINTTTFNAFTCNTLPVLTSDRSSYNL